MPTLVVWRGVFVAMSMLDKSFLVTNVGAALVLLCFAWFTRDEMFLSEGTLQRSLLLAMPEGVFFTPFDGRCA